MTKQNETIICRAPFHDLHSCDALIVICSDFRFQEAYPKLRRQLGIKTADLIAIPGGILQITKDALRRNRQALDWAVFLAKAHQARRVVLIDHEECLARKSAGYTFSSRENEQEFCAGSMLEVARILREEFRKSGINPPIHLIYARIIGQKRRLTEFVEFVC